MPDAGQLSDEELVRRVQDGDRETFAVLVRRHERSVYWFVHGVVQNHADSEEVLQESFLKAFEHIASFRGEARFRTWLIQIALNEARMRRRKYRASLHDSLDENWERKDLSELRPRELTDWRPSPEETLAKEELASLVHRGIRALPAIYREVILLREVESLSTEETAAVLGITTAAVKTRLLRARLMMREFLAPHLKMRWRQRFLARILPHRRSATGDQAKGDQG